MRKLQKPFLYSSISTTTIWKTMKDIMKEYCIILHKSMMMIIINIIYYMKLYNIMKDISSLNTTLIYDIMKCFVSVM